MATTNGPATKHGEASRLAPLAKAPEEHRGGASLVSAEVRPRLLIADDDPVVRQLLAGLLSERFNVVGMAQDGESAIELARRELPDAALVDVVMPAGGGLYATRGIRAASPGTAVVILSGDETGETFGECMKAGAMSYIRKDGPPELIAQALHKSIAATRPVGQTLARIEGLMSAASTTTAQREDPPGARSATR